MSWQEKYLDKYYRSKPGWQDGTGEFFEFIRSNISDQAEVLELGCGPSNDISQFLAANFGSLDGLDIDADCRHNDALRNAYVYDGGPWPVEDASYDAVVANYVLEHVEKPDDLLAELWRALRPGGVFLFRVPNKYHYVSLISRLTPQWFHELFANRLRNLPAESHDPYPTFYRMNSAGMLQKLFAGHGFERIEMRSIEKEPSYGMSSRFLFFTFMLYERLVNSTAGLAGLRSNIIGAFRKKI